VIDPGLEHPRRVQDQVIGAHAHEFALVGHQARQVTSGEVGILDAQALRAQVGVQTIGVGRFEVDEAQRLDRRGGRGRAGGTGGTGASGGHDGSPSHRSDERVPVQPRARVESGVELTVQYKFARAHGHHP
jgi:hypothetical protein